MSDNARIVWMFGLAMAPIILLVVAMIVFAINQSKRFRAEMQDSKGSISADQTTGWRPIETAPQEFAGRAILVATSRWVVAAKWNGIGWVTAGEGKRLRQPTHWQPMPLPPTEERDNA